MLVLRPLQICPAEPGSVERISRPRPAAARVAQSGDNCCSNTSGPYQSHTASEEKHEQSEAQPRMFSEDFLCIYELPV